MADPNPNADLNSFVPKPHEARCVQDALLANADGRRNNPDAKRATAAIALKSYNTLLQPQ